MSILGFVLIAAILILIIKADMAGIVVKVALGAVLSFVALYVLLIIYLAAMPSEGPEVKMLPLPNQSE